MVRAHFRRHVDAALLAPAHEFHGTTRTQVTHVNVSTRSTREQDVTNDVDLLGLRGNSLEPELRGHQSLIHRTAVRERHVFAVFGNRHVEPARVFECGAHEMRAFNRPPIIAERNGSRCNHLAHFSKCLTLL